VENLLRSPHCDAAVRGFLNDNFRSDGENKKKVLASGGELKKVRDGRITVLVCIKKKPTKSGWVSKGLFLILF